MGTEQQQAFDKLKSCLISVLAMRIDNATYYLGTDASDTSDTWRGHKTKTRGTQPVEVIKQDQRTTPDTVVITLHEYWSGVSM